MKEGAIIHRNGAIALCKAKGCQFKRHPLLGFAVQITGASPCVSKLTTLKEGEAHFLPTFFSIHPEAKQTAVRRCRSCLSKRREVVFGIRLENEELLL